MPNTVDDFIKLERDLYPSGDAFAMPTGGELETMSRALAIEKVEVNDTATNVLDVIYPDNDNFTIQDANDWYVRLGIYNSGSVSLDDMKLAIAERLGRLNEQYYRQDHAYITSKLVAAGFNVKIYENRFDLGGGPHDLATQPPTAFLFGTFSLAEIGSCTFAETEFGVTYDHITFPKVVDHVQESRDAGFFVYPNMRSTFYVAAPTAITDYADVPLARKDEFRQLLIQLKPAQTVGYLIVNYI